MDAVERTVLILRNHGFIPEEAILDAKQKNDIKKGFFQNAKYTEVQMKASMKDFDTAVNPGYPAKSSQQRRSPPPSPREAPSQHKDLSSSSRSNGQQQIQKKIHSLLQRTASSPRDGQPKSPRITRRATISRRNTRPPLGRTVSSPLPARKATGLEVLAEMRKAMRTLERCHTRLEELEKEGRQGTLPTETWKFKDRMRRRLLRERLVEAEEKMNSECRAEM